MINSGWTAAQAQYFYDLIRNSHRVRVGVHLLNMQHQVLADVSWLLISGQVDMDANSDITRSCKLSMLDPNNILGLDYPSGGYGQNYYNRMFRIWYEIVPMDASFGPSVYYPLFTGPITDVDRDGPVYDIECQGKEVLATEGIVVPWTWPAGWAKSSIMVNYIRDILGDDFTSLQGIRPEQVIAQPWSVDAGENMWARFKDMADGFNYNLYYDAWGVCQLKPYNRAPVFEFNETMMTGPANVAFDIDNLVNCIRAVGGTPEGLEGRYIAEAYPPPSHPLSPWALTRSSTGVPRYIVEIIEDDSLLSQQAVNDVAYATLSDRLLTSLDVTFTSVIVPHLEEWDMIQINSSRYWGWVRHTKQSIPLVGDGEMSVGFLASSSYAVELGGGVPWSVIAKSPDFQGQQNQIDRVSKEKNDFEKRKQLEKQRLAAKNKPKDPKFKKLNAGKKKKPKKGQLGRGDK